MVKSVAAIQNNHNQHGYIDSIQYIFNYDKELALSEDGSSAERLIRPQSDNEQVNQYILENLHLR